MPLEAGDFAQECLEIGGGGGLPDCLLGALGLALALFEGMGGGTPLLSVLISLQVYHQ